MGFFCFNISISKYYYNPVSVCISTYSLCIQHRNTLCHIFFLSNIYLSNYCEIFVLNRDDFNRIKSEYSEFKDVLKRMSSEKTEKISALILDGIIL